MSWATDIMDRLSDRAKKWVVSGIVTVFLSAGGGGSYLVFAKNADFQIHLAQHSIVDTRKEIRLLEELMLEYRKNYGKELEDATDKQKDIYKDWDDDLDDLRDDLKAAKKKARG